MRVCLVCFVSKVMKSFHVTCVYLYSPLCNYILHSFFENFSFRATLKVAFLGVLLRGDLTFFIA